VDYSRFDGLKLDDGSEADGAAKAKADPVPENSSIQVAKQAAYGSSWNANSYHYEERDYTSWGKKRLNELLDKVDTNGLPFSAKSQEFTLELKTEMKKLDGDAWCNIRKGKKLTCFNYELELAFKGHIAGGTNKWDLEGKFFYEVAVDDDEPETRFEFKQRYPFQKEVEKALCNFVTAKFSVFVAELSAKGNGQKKEGFAAKTETRVQVGQYQKYEQGPDGVKALQETAKKYSDKMNAAAKEQDKPAKHLHCENPTH